jgi:hypothetical protein
VSFEAVALDHGAHGTVQHQDALGEQFTQEEDAVWLQGKTLKKQKNPSAT